MGIDGRGFDSANGNQIRYGFVAALPTRDHNGIERPQISAC